MHDPEDFVTAVSRSDVRALLIGRRALVALGAPLMTADYDFWIHIDDIEAFNAIAEAFDLFANHPPDEARKRGRYVLENDEHVDVLVARSMPGHAGDRLRFEDFWRTRQYVELAEEREACLPSIEDLIRTKRAAGRPKDVEDIAFLEELNRGAGA